MSLELAGNLMLLVLIGLSMYRNAQTSARLRRAERAMLALSRATETSVRGLERNLGAQGRAIDHIVESLVAAGIKPTRRS